MVCAQQFLNPGLEDVPFVDSTTIIPMYWDHVLASYPLCLATELNETDTPDLTFLNGPKLDLGIAGTPQSGETFVSGLHGQSTLNSNVFYDEGIKQTVSGFTPDSSYTIFFYQSVVGQLTQVDTSGNWQVIMDFSTIGVTEPSSTSTSPLDPQLEWERRQVSFQATNTEHTFYFLPRDDDDDVYVDENNLSQGIRMGIDSIYLYPRCYINEDGTQQFVCTDNETAILSLDVPNGQYQWSTGATSSSIEANLGAYQVTVTGEEGCRLELDASVALNPAVTYDLGPDITLCEPLTDTEFIGEAFVPDASYEWQNGTVGHTFGVMGPGTYWVTMNYDGCIGGDTIVYTESPISEIELPESVSLCPGGEVSVMATPVFSDLDYTWSDSGESPTLTTSVGGIYSLTVTDADCILMDSVFVIDLGEQHDLGADQVLCYAETLLLATPLAAETYSWQDGSVAPTLLADSPGSYSLTVTVEDCVLVDSVMLSASDLLPFSLGEDLILCYDEAVTLEPTTAITADTYNWSNNNTNTPFQMVAEAGDYILTASLGDCQLSDTIVVMNSPLLPLSFATDTVICSNAVTGVSLAEGNPIDNAIYTWQGSDGSTYNEFNPIVLPATSTQYTLLAEMDDCMVSTTTDIGVTPIVIFGIDDSESDTLLQAGALQLLTTLSGGSPQDINWTFAGETIGFGTSLNWQPSASQIDLLPAYVYAHFENNCYSLTDSILISLPTFGPYKLPNIFSPDNDGTNDVFKPFYIGEMDAVELQIYNRWGQLVFSSNDPANPGWDGTYEGKPASAEVYIYAVRLQLGDIIAEETGQVTLVR